MKFAFGKTKNAQSGSQDALVSAMTNPEFYPRRPAEVTHKETHISHVFLSGDLVYKIKKPVRFSFLDYSTLNKRLYFLQEELRLNRRLAPSVYLAVTPILFDESGWHLGGLGPPAEYTLIMRRLPEKRMLPFLLETGQVTPEMMHRLAEILAPFHAQADKIEQIGVAHYPQAVERQWTENLADVKSFLETAIEAEAFNDFGTDFMNSNLICSYGARLRGGFVMFTAIYTAIMFALRRREFRSTTASNSAPSSAAAILPLKSPFSSWIWRYAEVELWRLLF